MIIKSSSQFEIDVSDMQFLTGIALSFLGEDAIARAVIKMHKDEPGKREDLFQGLLGSKGIWDYVQFLYNNACIPAEVGGEVRMRVGMVSISNCVSASVTAGAIYTEAMKVLLHHSVDSLIVAFARTPLFKNEFRSFYINDIGRLGQSSVFRELGEEGRNDFFEEVYKRFLARTRLYFAKGYDAVSCTPVAYLRNAYQVYFLRDKVNVTNDLFNYLYQKGQDLNLPDGKTTSLSVVGIDCGVAEAYLDFKSVVANISLASEVLFWHNHGSTIYSNIVSYYRKRRIARILDENVNIFKRLTGIKVSRRMEPDMVAADDATLRTKYSARIKYCDILEDAILDNRNVDMLRLYEDLKICSRNNSIKNATKLFSEQPGKILQQGKHSLSNGDLFQVLVNGYIALKKLLQYVEDKKGLGLSVYSVPDFIFMDLRYARRFSTLEDCLACCETVMKLKEEASKVAIVEKNLKLNDLLYDDFCISGVAASERLKAWLIKRPYVNLREQISRRARETEETNYHGIARTFSRVFNNYLDQRAVLTSNDKNHVITALQVALWEKDDVAHLPQNRPVRLRLWNAILGRLEALLHDELSRKCHVVRQGLGDEPALAVAITTAMAYLEAILQWMDTAGAGILQDGKYYLTCDSLADYVREKADPSFPDSLVEWLRKKEGALPFIYLLFFGKPCKQVDNKVIFELLYTHQMLKVYIGGIYRMASSLHENSMEGNYLTLVTANQFRHFLGMTKLVRGYEELSAFIQRGNVPVFGVSVGIDAMIRSIEEAKVLCLMAYNRYVGLLSGLYYHMSLLTAGVAQQESFGLNSYQDVSVVNALLDKQKAIITGTTGAIDQRVKGILSCLPHDETGYLLDGGRRYCSDGKYYLIYGYEVKIQEAVQMVSHRQMGEMEAHMLIEVLKQRSQWL